MTRREDNCPYHNNSADYYADAQPSPMQKRVAAVVILLCLAIVALFSFGCLGAPVAIRTIEGKELQLSQEINWLTGTRLTVSGKDVKTYVQSQPLSPASAVSKEREIEAHVNGVVGAGVGDSLPGTGVGHGGPAVSVVPLETPVPGSLSAPK